MFLKLGLERRLLVVVLDCGVPFVAKILDIFTIPFYGPICRFNNIEQVTVDFQNIINISTNFFYDMIHIIHLLTTPHISPNLT